MGKTVWSEESPHGWGVSPSLGETEKTHPPATIPGCLRVSYWKEDTAKALAAPWVGKLVAWPGLAQKHVGDRHRVLDMPLSLDLLELEGSQPQPGGKVTLTPTASVTN